MYPPDHYAGRTSHAGEIALYTEPQPGRELAHDAGRRTVPSDVVRG
ncbi:hypothetical protein SAMN05421810_104503 [Amycolatopsis arida]|uniref:Uncharacterized protein n=1 Tax=Amycolatopsis arida TaxID=587909 RepID=A0A1I5VTM9_9PSEU|nr:hypothetical protein CLV69_112149 [Amycolatopsis arida]SFQ10637.1 hypothetical protein SAMN05421810_104503 [Amycolatopsis arida]